MPPVVGELCVANAYVLRDEVRLACWPAHAIFEAEIEGEMLECEDWILARGPVRLLRRLETWTEDARWSYAADAAEHVLPLFERRFPADPRPRRAVDAARLFARGRIPASGLRTAGHAIVTCHPDSNWGSIHAAAAAWQLAIAPDGASATCTVGSMARQAVAWVAADVHFVNMCPSDVAGLDAARDDAVRREMLWQAQRLRSYLSGGSR
jgi:hypothetical protein